MFVKLGTKYVNFDHVSEFTEASTGEGMAVNVTFSSGESRRYKCSASDTIDILTKILPAPDGYFCVALDEDGTLAKSPIIGFRYFGPQERYDVEPITVGYPNDGGILRPDGVVIVPQAAEYPSLDAFLADQRAMREKR